VERPFVDTGSHTDLEASMAVRPPYDPASPSSIERYAKRLVDRTLREMLAEEIASYGYQTGKGRFGDIVERSYFGINPGNISAPDFTEAGVELKTTPLKRVGKKLRAKERLVLQMIDYMAVHRESWETSSFLEKNSLLLLLFYLWERDADMSGLRLQDCPSLVVPGGGS
jgi:DNA mismatch repair protein MutH